MLLININVMKQSRLKWNNKNSELDLKDYLIMQILHLHIDKETDKVSRV